MRDLHAAFAPHSYLEVGIRSGDSIQLAKCPSIGVDPEFAVNCELRGRLWLVRTTSDEFFARPDPMSFFDSGRIDLGFIDGMHLFEFALRDFINVERFAGVGSVAVFDDIFPTEAEQATRDRTTLAWTGDVWKVLPVLRAYRPDLVLLPVDTLPTGVLVVCGLDSSNTVLGDHYDEIVSEWVERERDVPTEILEREGKVEPTALLDSAVWDVVRDLRVNAVDPATAQQRIRAVLDSGERRRALPGGAASAALGPGRVVRGVGRRLRAAATALRTG
jgi:hypothetical protein